jgi:hypothetical protein
MTTLTYQVDLAPKNGSTSKRHLNAFLQKLRRDKMEYLWFMEFQRNGSVHYHVLSDLDCSETAQTIGGRLVDLGRSKSESQRWSRIVSGGFRCWGESTFDKMASASVRVEPIRSFEGAAKYVCKYAYKPEQKSVPDGFSNCGRFWGASRGTKPVVLSRSDQVGTAGLSGWQAPIMDEHGSLIGGTDIPHRVQFGS